MNVDVNRSHIGDVHGSIASNNNTTIINISGDGPPGTLLGRSDGRANIASRYNFRPLTNGYATSLRAPPNDFFGRDGIRADIVRTLLHSEVKSALVLGTGGIGKTAVALTVLHDHAIVDRFEGSRYFVSCEGLDSMDLFLQRLAEILGIDTPDEKILLEEKILSALSLSNCLLCIDNLETLWDSPHTRNIEEIIAKLIHLPTVAVIVMMRGIERPLEPKWAAVHELKPLLQPPSSQVFCSAAGISVDNIDKYGKLLVEAADGIPLGLTLLGHLIRPGADTPKDVWGRWIKRKTAILNRERGTRDPHLSVDTSIEFSLESQRVKADPFAKATLGILSLLPDGIPRDSNLDIVNCLSASLPGDHDLEKSLSTLTDVALAFVENSRSRRYQILSPIREFARSRLDSILPHDQQAGVVQYFLHLILENRNHLRPRCFPVRDELVNIGSILKFAYESPWLVIKEHDLAHASIEYTKWTMYMGSPVEDVILLAEQQFWKDVQLLSDVYSSHGNLHLYLNRLQDCEEALTRAFKLHKEAQDTHGQANDLQSLGTLYMRLNKLDDAEKALKEALELHWQVLDYIGQANDLGYLGKLYLRLGKLNHAEKALAEALELDQQVQSSWQACDLNDLGELYMRLNKIDDAEKALAEALKLFQQAQYSYGQANVLLNLGELFMRLDKPEDAEKLLLEAFDLYKQAQSSHGKADALNILSKLYIQLNKLDDAEKSLNEALSHCQQAQDSHGKVVILQALGDLYMRLDKQDDAKKVLAESLDIHEQAHSSIDRNAIFRLCESWRTTN